MSERTTGTGGTGDLDPDRPRFTDKRRIDPETGAVRDPAPAPAEAGSDSEGEELPEQGAEASGAESDLAVARAEASERLDDLRRLQAEFINYRRRVDRDRLVARDQTVVAMVEALLGVLDDVELARQHGGLTEGPFSAVAEKLESSLARFGWERFGVTGEPFDPTVHEALMHAHSAEVSEPTVVQVLQPGHRVGERVVRAARVAVADPEA